MNQPAQGCGGDFQVVRDGHRDVGGQTLDVGDPQPMLELVAGSDVKALRTDGANHHEAGTGVFQFADRRQSADIGKGLLDARLSYLRALRQQNHAKWCAGPVTAADHVQVAHLENAQLQYAAREEHRAQGEQRQGLQGKC